MRWRCVDPKRNVRRVSPIDNETEEMATGLDLPDLPARAEADDSWHLDDDTEVAMGVRLHPQGVRPDRPAIARVKLVTLGTVWAVEQESDEDFMTGRSGRRDSSGDSDHRTDDAVVGLNAQSQPDC